MILGEIRMFAGRYAPRGWAFCHGQELEINATTQLLFSLLGTTYGGDGRTTFALPNMATEPNGVVPMHKGNGPGLTPRKLGQSVGSNDVDMTDKTAPPHTHQLMASADTAYVLSPSQYSVLAKGPGTAAGGDLTRFYSTAAPNSVMAPEMPIRNPGNLSNLNVMRGLILNFIIALQGDLPPRTGPYVTNDPLIGEVSIMPYGFVPADWLACDGQTVSIAEYAELYGVIGTGSQRDAFRLPNLQTCVPINFSEPITYAHTGSNTGSGYWPDHSHTIQVDNTTPGSKATADPEDHVLGSARFQGSTDNNVYYQDQGEGNAVFLANESVSYVGDFPKPNTKNMQPYLGVQFCICIRGDYPFRGDENP